MKRMDKNGIKIEKDCCTPESFFGSLGIVVMLRSILIAAGLNFIFLSLFSSVGVSPILLTAVEIPICCLLSIMLRGKHSGMTVFMCCSAILLYAIIALPQIRQGVRLLMNDCINALIRTDGKIRLSVDVEHTSPIWILLLFCSINVLVSSKLASIQSSVLPIFITACALCYVLSGLAPSAYGPMLLTIAGLTGVMYAPSGTKVIANVSNNGCIRSSIIGIISVLLLFSMAVSLAIPLKNICGEKFSSEVRDAFHSALFDSTSNTMPEGRLSTVSARKKSSAPALAVNYGHNKTKEKVFSRYFRGMTGDVYTGHSWVALSKGQLFEYNDLFYWLHKSGFYAQTQFTTALDAVVKGEDSDPEIYIENISACKKYLYLPYTAKYSELLDTSYIGDLSCLRSKQVGLSYSVNCVTDYPSIKYIQSAAASNDSEDAVDYLAAERAYSEFVHENYLQLTPEAAATLSRIFGEEPPALELKKIFDLVYTALSDNIIYDEEIKGSSGENDFAMYVLEVSKCGYDVHYASCAALMLRYFGVPARYVEGYYFEGTDHSDATVMLTEKDAHAWAEYYVEGVGWIPFEATPGYEKRTSEDQDQPDVDDSNSPDDQDDQDSTYKNDKLPDISLARPPKKLDSSSKIKLNRAILLLLLFALLLVALLIVILRRILLRRAVFRMLHADNNESIAMMFGYMVMLSEKLEVPSLIDEEASMLNDEAVFSNHCMSDEQKTAMLGCLNKALAQCIRSRSFVKRCFDRFIACLYI